MVNKPSGLGDDDGVRFLTGVLGHWCGVFDGTEDDDADVCCADDLTAVGWSGFTWISYDLEEEKLHQRILLILEMIKLA